MNQPFPSSKESIKRFIRLMLSLKETIYWYHQTLTFGEGITDPIQAKKKLMLFFNCVQAEFKKEHRVAIVYVMGKQEGGRIHFHVLFLFYDAHNVDPEELRKKLWGIIWERWQKHSPKAENLANQLILCTKKNALWYLLQHVNKSNTRKEKSKPLWWGRRNNDLLRANSIEVTDAEVDKAYNRSFRCRKEFYLSILDRPKEKYGWRSLKEEKKLAKETGYDWQNSWEAFKSEKYKKATGISKPISDQEFIQFRKEYGFLK